MTKCFICNKDLINGVASAKKNNGDYYLLCNNCGNVHYVKVLSNGLTQVERTGDENNEETTKQIVEAHLLFSKVGVDIMKVKVGVHSEKENIKDLIANELSKEEEMALKNSYDNLPYFVKGSRTFEEYKEEFIKFKKLVNESPKASSKEIVSNIFNFLNMCEEEGDCCYDCEECNYDCEEDCYENEESEEEFDGNIEELFKDALPKYIIEAIDFNGKDVIAEACNEEDLKQVFKDAEENNVVIQRVSKINVTLSPIEISKTYKYEIKDI